MSNQNHWQSVYSSKESTAVSWYRKHLEQSLELIERCKLADSAAIVDVGGGASTLVDDLLERGFTDVTVIDLAAAAFEQVRKRLGPSADKVHWLVGDVTTPLLAADSIDLWHDRAVFHFMTEPEQRAAYLEQVRRVVRVGGYVLLGTFALDGPERCSGLEVARYSPDGLFAQLDSLAAGFEKVAEAREVHETPWGSEQAFSYVLVRRG